MRIIILTISALIMVSCSDDYPAGKVPSVVQNIVRAKFPGAIDIDWKKHTDGYEAEFDLNSKEYTVYVDATGTIVSYKHEIIPAEFPAAVIATISNEYPGYKIDEAEKVEKDNIIYYQAELDGKQKKELQLIFSTEGRLVTDINFLK